MSRSCSSLFAALLAVLLAVPLFPEPAQALVPVSGAGSSFAALEIDQWRADVSHAPYNLKVDYTAAGSTFGRNQYIEGRVDFAASDIQFEDEVEISNLNKSPRRNFVYVPVSAGGLGFMYNVIGNDGRRIENLRLSQRNVCRAFTEPGIFWDDPAIAAENPGVPLPHQPIKRVVRSDGAGQSFVFMEYCIAVAPDVWNAFISYILGNASARDTASVLFRQGKPSSQWPSGYDKVAPAAGSDGVANAVADGVTGKYSVTFVEAGFAKVRRYPVALVRNGAGEYTSPLDSAAVSVALAYAKGRTDGTFELAYLAADKRAYFPSTYSYMIVQTEGYDASRGASVATFLQYAVTRGQRNVELIGYARLSIVLVNLALDQIQKIPGAPPRPTDLGDPPPAPSVDLATAGKGSAVGPEGGPAGAGGTAGQASEGTHGSGSSGLALGENDELIDPDEASAAATLARDGLWWFAVGVVIAALVTWAKLRRGMGGLT